jgi:hypothetical protein
LELLKLAQDRRVVLVSTIGAAQPAAALARSGYSTTKREAELVCEATATLRCGTAIVRPGAIGPHSISGAANLNDYRVLQIVAMMQQRAAPLSSMADAQLRFVAVDYVARRTVALALSDEAAERAVRLVPLVGARGVAWSEVVAALRRHIPTLRTDVAFDEWRDGVVDAPFRALLGSRFLGSALPLPGDSVADAPPLTPAALSALFHFIDDTTTTTTTTSTTTSTTTTT